jgi:hypothetical protein
MITADLRAYDEAKVISNITQLQQTLNSAAKKEDMKKAE